MNGLVDMAWTFSWLGARRRRDPFAPVHAEAFGLPSDVEIATRDGILPIWSLSAGDRIITRTGWAPLRAIRMTHGTVQAVTVPPATLGSDAPDHAVTLPAGQPLLLRGEPALRLTGRDHAVVPAARLARAMGLAPPCAVRMTVLLLGFDTPQILYASGLELAAPDTATLRALPLDPGDTQAGPREGLPR
ncbi:Hint domain-containing protein [Citreimonas salinaria]|uniref:Hint domain-containing protein n=1 Tax=Citreimonas salinaria TaxID=321339 RepID=A0A1H3H109_9RHOB|nr:Hint domain-containing protein [Citreimonas salinaria]SDY09202.1 Hint domain-containing protein [Citreimonas salinaria]